MKARVKETGDIVTVMNYSAAGGFIDYLVDGMRDYASIEVDKVEIINDDIPQPNSIDWEQRRFDIVKTALHGYITSAGAEYMRTDKQFKAAAKLSIDIADVMLAEYTKGGEQ